MGNWQRKRRRSARPRHLQNASFVNEPRRQRRRIAAPLRTPVRRRCKIEPSTSWSARAIEPYGYEAFITNRDSTEATSMVCGTRQCHHLRKESGAAFSSHPYMSERPNLECVATFLPTVSFGILPDHVYLASHTAFPTRSKPTRLRSTVFRPRTPEN